MKAKILSSTILACLPLMVSVGCTAKDNNPPAQKAQSATTASDATTNSAVNSTASNSVADNLAQAKKQAIKAQEDAYNAKYGEQFNVQNGCDNGAILIEPYTTDEQVANDYVISNYEYNDNPDIITFKTIAYDRFLIGDYNFVTKKADNYHLLASVSNCAMFNDYDKTFVTDNYGNKYDIMAESVPSSYRMADEPFSRYIEHIKVPVGKETLTKYRDKGITFTLHAWASPDGKTPRKFSQDIYVEPNIIRVALDVTDSDISSTAVDDR